MAAPMLFNVYVGAETGLLKGIHAQNNHWENLNSIEKADKTKEIVSLNWSNDTETELCIGLKNQHVTVFDTETRQNKNEFSFDAGKGKLRNVVKIHNKYVTSVDSGVVKCWEDEEVTRQWNTGDNLHFTCHNWSQKTIFATGGKENDLKIWNLDVETTPIFTAKNVKNDWLNLRVPVWVTGALFIPSSDKVVTCTGHHQIRVYDPKAQRRPVMDMAFDEYPLTSISMCPQSDHLIVVGNTHGKMGTVDIRKGQMVNLFKGFAGGIRHIQCHKSLPIVASCGLDRYLRVHDLNTKALLYKFYLKSRLNCVAVAEKWDVESSEGESDTCINVDTENIEIKQEPDDAEEELWGQFQIVQTKTKRKHDRVVDMNVSIAKKSKQNSEKVSRNTRQRKTSKKQ